MSDSTNHGAAQGEFGPDETLADIAHDHHPNYTAIFVLLCVCTGLSWFFDEMKNSFSYTTLIVLVLGVALCKATFVLLYFMHIKFERAWKYVLLAPTGVLAIALPFALAPDMSFHYYGVVAPQRDIAAADHEAEAHGAPAHTADEEPGAPHHDGAAHKDHK